MDLTEAEDIKKRWQEYTEELYKKDLHYQDKPKISRALSVPLFRHYLSGTVDESYFLGQ